MHRFETDDEPEREYWYRYEDYRTANYDPWGEYEDYGSSPAIRCTKFEVIKHTPKGAWLRVHGYVSAHGDKRFVLRGSRKRFACPTKKEAIESFLARKERQKGIYQSRINHIDEVIFLAQLESTE